MQQQLVVKNSTGEVETTGWTTFKTLWCRVVPMTATERFKAAEVHASKVSKFWVRWMSGIETTMRIYFDGKYYRITGISEVGRRDYLEIVAEALDGNY